MNGAVKGGGGGGGRRGGVKRQIERESEFIQPQQLSNSHYVY